MRHLNKKVSTLSSFSLHLSRRGILRVSPLGPNINATQSNELQLAQISNPILNPTHQTRVLFPSFTLSLSTLLFVIIFLLILKPSINPETLLCTSTTKMGAKAKKTTMRKNLKKKASSLALSSVSVRKNESADFLPLEGGPARKIPNQKLQEPLESTATVLYIGRIPHGFYEDEMREFFKQFGAIKHLRIARSRKTGKSKHFGFIEFESPEVAKIVADCMHNYLLLEHMLQVHLIPQEHVHPKLWKGVDYKYAPPNWTEIARKRHNKERTIEEHRKLVKVVLKKDKKRRRKIEAAGIDYVPPEIVGSIQPAPKKIKFDD